jgi:hypothetical protein
MNEAVKKYVLQGVGVDSVVSSPILQRRFPSDGDGDGDAYGDGDGDGDGDAYADADVDADADAYDDDEAMKRKMKLLNCIRKYGRRGRMYPPPPTHTHTLKLITSTSTRKTTLVLKRNSNTFLLKFEKKGMPRQVEVHLPLDI